MFGFAARVSKSHPRVSQLALFKTSAVKALALAIKASEAASAPAFSSVSHATSTLVCHAAARDGDPFDKFANALAEASQMTASIFDSTSCSLNVRNSMEPKKRKASSNCFSNEYVGDAKNGVEVFLVEGPDKGSETSSLFSVTSKLSSTCSGVKGCA